MDLEKQSTQKKHSEDQVGHTWVMDTTQAMRKPGGRDLGDYKEFLGFNEKSLEGKTILDLGSGSQEKLSRGLREAGVKANVIALNPDYNILKYRKIINRQEDWERKSVGFTAQALPFKDSTFDCILGLESVTMYEDALEKPLSAQAWSREVARVLKPGGEARLGEILGMGGVAKKEAWQEIIKLFEGLGLEAKIEPFKIRENNPTPRYRIIIKKPKIQ